MENNTNKIANIKIDKDNMILKSSKNIYCESFYFMDMYDENLYKKFIKQTERIIRSSKEYNAYIEELRTNIHALNYDSIMSNICNADADLEIHHYPLTLYDIVEVIVNYHLINKDKITSFSIAKEVMECHFKNIIGIVSLTTTNHQLAHTGSIFLNKKQIFGNYEEFLNIYSNGVNVEIKNKIERLNKLSDNNTAIDFKGIL